MSLLWMVRDAALVTFYLREGLLDAVDIALVFYTGKTPLSHLEADLRGRSSVYLVDGRPGDLGEVVLDVVEAVETHQALPECRFRPTGSGGYGGGPRTARRHGSTRSSGVAPRAAWALARFRPRFAPKRCTGRGPQPR